MNQTEPRSSACEHANAIEGSKPDGIRFEEYAPPTPTVEEFKRSIVRHLRADLLHSRATAKPRDWWTATCLASRDWAVIRFARTQRQRRADNPRRVYYEWHELKEECRGDLTVGLR
jgi:glucan phosphorylase